jgi:hypothetical protein
MADVGPAEVVTEPVAAAVHVASTQRFDDGDRLAVYDLGGGTFDAAVLRKQGEQFELLGVPAGIEHLGGVDFDAAVYGHVVRALGADAARLESTDEATAAALARLQRDCTEAKEALSADSEAVIAVTLPDLVRQVRLTRSEFEDLIRPALVDTVLCLRRAMASAGVSPPDLAAVVLAGGSSRIPLVAEMLGTELGRPIAVTAYPKSAVALGAARLAGRGLPAAAAVPGRAPAGRPAGPAGKGTGTEAAKDGGRGFWPFGRRHAAVVPVPAPQPVATLLAPDSPAGPPDPGPPDLSPTQPIDPVPIDEVATRTFDPTPEPPDHGGVAGFHDATRPPDRRTVTTVTGPGRRTWWLAGVGVVVVAVVVAALTWPRGGGGTGATPRPSGSTTTTTTTTTTGPSAERLVTPGDWTGGADLPGPREAAGAATFQDRVWVAGGHQNTIAAMDSVQVFDPATGSWSDGPRLPAPLHDPALASDEQHLYVIGGQDDDGVVQSRVLVLNDQQTAWVDGPALPEARVAGAAVFDGTRIVFGGGNTGKADDGTVWALEGQGWVELGRLHVPRNSLVAVSDGAGTVWFLTGEQIKGPKRQQVAVGSTDVLQGGTVTAGPDWGKRRAAAGAYLPGYGPCVFGGKDGDTFVAGPQCREQPTGGPPFPDLPTLRAGLVAAIAGTAGTVLVTAGGFYPGHNASGKVELLPLSPG